MTYPRSPSKTVAETGLALKSPEFRLVLYPLGHSAFEVRGHSQYIPVVCGGYFGSPNAIVVEVTHFDL